MNTNELAKTACVVGLGNLIMGESSAGFLAIEGLAQESLGEIVSTHYLAGAYHSLPFYLHGMQAAVIILSACLTGKVGRVHRLSHWQLRKHVANNPEAPQELKTTVVNLQWAKLAYGLPKDIQFFIIDTDLDQDEYTSSAFRQGVRKTIQFTLDFLRKHGCAPPRQPVTRIYRVSTLNMSF
jgi:Ni,Fe-hydrogenase maturation factor